MPQNVVLEGGPPWGFRLTGGTDQSQPISISRVTPGTKASLANLYPGDVILAIGGVATEVMTAEEAQQVITGCPAQLCLKIQRPLTTLWSPQIEPFSLFSLNLETVQQQVHTLLILQAQQIQDLGHFEHKFNVRPRPFGAPAPVVTTETIDDNNNSVRRPVTRSVVAPVTKPQPPVAQLQKLPLCDLCGKGIIGAVVRAGEKWRHPGCFLCVACGQELKHQGYYLIEGQLYCKQHASDTMQARE